MSGAAREASTDPLLEVPARNAPLDWRGRPTSRSLGGWKGSLCLLGAMGARSLAYFGLSCNLVIYLVQVCGLTNVAAASTVSNLTGTTLVCSFLGAVVSDAYVGRLWMGLIFQIFSALLYGLINIAVMASARSFLLVSLYLMNITTGPLLPILITLGADQLRTSEDTEKYFRLLAIMASIGQLLGVTAVTYVDNAGLWVWGFGLCTASAIVAGTLTLGGASWLFQYRASGNPFLRNLQVLVAAWRKRSLPRPMDSSLMYGDLSGISGQHKLQHTSTLGCLDKAAVLGPKETFDPWRLCTVTQVEELKCLVRVIPAGIAVIAIYVASAQVSTLFEEQASVMKRQVAPWLAIPPASLNVVSICSSIVTGTVSIMAGGTRVPAWCYFGRGRRGRAQKASPLQLLGVGVMGSMMSMAIAATIERHRRLHAQEGVVISIMWLMPQTVLVGVCSYLLQSAGLDFFYSEVSEGMRSVSGSFLYIFGGAGSFASSILVSLVTVITKRGGQAGWVADDLNEGHVDYYYWFLACFLALAFGSHIVYARSYIYVGQSSTEHPSSVSS